MQDVIQRRNTDLLRDIDQLLESLNQASIPDELQNYRQQLVAVCHELQKQIQRNRAYLHFDQEDILNDVLSHISRTTHYIHLINAHLAVPILRASASDRLCLAMITWQHQTHPHTEIYPAAFVDGPPSIWPFHHIHIPLYVFPVTQQRSLRFLPLLLHEFAHLLYGRHKLELDDLVAELQEDIADTLVPAARRNDQYAEQQAGQRHLIVDTWYSWAQELFCDAVGFVMSGPCYIRAFATFVNGMHRSEFYRNEQSLAGSTHPVTWLRVQFLARRARDAGFETLADTLVQEWQRIAQVLGVIEDYHGFYHRALESRLIRTLQDMLTEVAPRCYTTEEVTGTGWDPLSDSPIRLLNWAWQQYDSDPETYSTWERDYIAALPDSMVVYQENQNSGTGPYQRGPIYTIGYGTRTMDEFMQLLKTYAIEYLIDVRSAPYSKYNRDFSQDSLRKKLQKHGIKYVFMGKELGGRPDDATCYTPDGRVDYAKLAETALYNQGVSRLHEAQNYRVVLMCTELRPHTCHRSKLIGRTLAQQGVDVQHIDEEGKLRGQDEVMQILVGEQPVQLGLFESPSSIGRNPSLTSRKPYRRRGQL